MLASDTSYQDIIKSCQRRETPTVISTSSSSSPAPPSSTSSSSKSSSFSSSSTSSPSSPSSSSSSLKFRNPVTDQRSPTPATRSIPKNKRVGSAVTTGTNHLEFQQEVNHRLHGIRLRSKRFVEKEFVPENAKTLKDLVSSREMAEKLLREMTQ